MGWAILLPYKNSTGGGVPSPVDEPNDAGNGGIWPLDEWALLLPKLAAAGCTAVVLGPSWKGASLGGGWDPFDHGDYGTKNQKGRRETRYGSGEKLRRFVAIAHRLGLQVYVNVVHHQLVGGTNQNYSPIGADGKTTYPRFDKNCFWDKGTQNPDTVFDPQWDINFGDEPRWESGTFGDGQGEYGPGYVKHTLVNLLRWFVDTTGIDGFFWDDAKGTAPEYFGYALGQPGIAGKYSFAEYYDGNPGAERNFVHCWQVAGRCSALDFTLRFAIRNVCNAPGNADIRQVLTNGYVYQDDSHSMTFVEDHDTDESGPVITNKMIGYATIMSTTGYPMAFGKDMYQKTGCYGLWDEILNAGWVHEMFANGQLVVHWDVCTYNLIVFERPGFNGYPGMLVCINNEPGSYSNPNDWKPVYVSNTNLPRNAFAHDYSGHAQDQWVDANGGIWLYPPPNDGGRGYSFFGEPGRTGVFTLPAVRHLNSFTGSAPLDIGPAVGGTTQTVAEIWCDAGTPIILYPGDSSHGLTFGLLNTNSLPMELNANMEAQAASRGWYTVTVTAPATVTTQDFEISVEYTATKELMDADLAESPTIALTHEKEVQQ